MAQASFHFRTHGGKRAGAGRPRQTPGQRVPHTARTAFGKMQPAHVTLRTVAALGNLRRPAARDAIRDALARVVARPDFRIVHISIQHDHLHLIVEADDHVALGLGLRAFQVSAAQRLNRALAPGRRGRVFADRYHARLLTCPTTARNALRYVLHNWRKHGEDKREQPARALDPFASGPNFPGWSELGDALVLYHPPRDVGRLPTCRPRTWLLERGWQRAGAISTRAAPG